MLQCNVDYVGAKLVQLNISVATMHFEKNLDGAFKKPRHVLHNMMPS